jgi:hypothetical protein
MSLRDETEGQFNKHFKEQPTDAMLIDYLDNLEIKCDEAVVLRKQRLARKRYGDLECNHITLSFDKRLYDEKITIDTTATYFKTENHQKIKESMLDFFHNFRMTNYKWAIDPVAVCEFNSENGFNPHVHIIARKNYVDNIVKSPSQVQQALKRKYVDNEKNKARFGIYSVHVKKLPISKGEDYVNGLKQDTKLADVEKDKIYRKKHGYDELYYLFDIN